MEVIIIEPHRTLDNVDIDFTQVLIQIIQVLLAVLVVEEMIEIPAILAILALLSRLLSFIIGKLVQLYKESCVKVRGLREVLGELLLPLLLLSRLLLSPPVHRLNLPILRLLISHPLPRRRFIQSMTYPFEISQWCRFLALLKFSEHDILSPRLKLGVHSRFRLYKY